MELLAKTLNCCKSLAIFPKSFIFSNEISNSHKVYERKFLELIMRRTEVVNGEKKLNQLSELLGEERDPVIIGAVRFSYELWVAKAFLAPSFLLRCFHVSQWQLFNTFTPIPPLSVF